MSHLGNLKFISICSMSTEPSFRPAVYTYTLGISSSLGNFDNHAFLIFYDKKEYRMAPWEKKDEKPRGEKH